MRVFLVWPIWGRQEHRQMFESTGNSGKTLSITRRHTIISNVSYTPSSPTPPPNTQTRTHWNIYHSVPVCWWPRLWIIYQQKCRNNLIEMKTHLLGIFFLHIKTFQIQLDRVVICCFAFSKLAGYSCPQLASLMSYTEYFNPENRTALLFYPNIPQLTLCNAIIISIPAYMH